MGQGYFIWIYIHVVFPLRQYSSRLRGCFHLEFNSDYWLILHAFFRLLIFFKIYFSPNSFRPNSLDPDQARHFVWPDLGLNCLQRVSADNTSRQELMY